jgi:hypothetical protein
MGLGLKSGERLSSLASEEDRDATILLIGVLEDLLSRSGHGFREFCRPCRTDRLSRMLAGGTESAGINRLGVENERVLR